MMEYSLDGHNVSLSAIRTVRVLRPLRAINRVPSELTPGLGQSLGSCLNLPQCLGKSTYPSLQTCHCILWGHGAGVTVL